MVKGALMEWTHLNIQNLCGNYLGKYGPETATALLTNPTLLSVDLRSNGFTEEQRTIVSGIFEQHNNERNEITRALLLSSLDDDNDLLLPELIGLVYEYS